ncbi:MAG: dihydroxy-acid dehydratase [Christensenellaceae bacterium]|jgi:dihydroxyacid dehydratase/phosphogluconate dehydratase|nr:dihydroxy-acid dehydratase [Christensenellaceae bacterium]
MIKLKAKNIENIAERAKERMLSNLKEGAKIGVLVGIDNLSGSYNYSLKLAHDLAREINRPGIECEIIPFPIIQDKFKTYTDESNFIEVFKEQTANMSELIISEKSFDGLVIVSRGISSIAGLIKGAVSVNVPTMVLSQGPSKEEKGAALNDLVTMVGKIAIGKNSVFDLNNAEETQIGYLGDGVYLNTQNLFNIILESIGLMVEGGSTAPAGSFKRAGIVSKTAEAIVSLTHSHTSIKKLLNKKTIQNAIITNYALGGSMIIGGILLELAKLADADINTEKAIGLIKNIPVLVQPNMPMSDFETKGGAYGLLKAMTKTKAVDEGVKFYNGQTLSETITNAKSAFETVKKESLIVLRGNIAERNGYLKTTSIPDGMTKFVGKARCFDSDHDAATAVLEKTLSKNTVIVLSRNGKKLGFGGQIISETACAISSMNLTNDIIVVTDGVMCDEHSVVVVGGVRPEDAGGIIYVRDGDEIELDFAKGRINADVASKEFNNREKKYVREYQVVPNHIKHYLNDINI